MRDFIVRLASMKLAELKFDVDRFVAVENRFSTSHRIPYDILEYYDRKTTFKEFKEEVQKTLSHIENVTITYLSTHYNIYFDNKDFHATYDLVISVKKAGKRYGKMNSIDVDISFAKKSTTIHKTLPNIKIHVLYSLSFKEDLSYEKLFTVKNLL